MKFIPLEIPDVVLIEPAVFEDRRGFFMETWRDDLFRQKIGDFSFVQDNHSKSSQGVLRGLHYQIKKSQGKLVRAVRGEIFDAAVDLRKHSVHFGRWVGVRLSSENKKILWVPPGFAHGFFVISEEAEFAYRCTDYYAPEHERCIRWNDPDLSIYWPVPNGLLPELSEKDAEGVAFKVAEVFE